MRKKLCKYDWIFVVAMISGLLIHLACIYSADHFADESLYYPYCDCEDRSILFTRMVRDLVGLPCILIYYPGHLATAVCFEEQVNGDYIMLGNKRFVTCDPTYIGAPIGATMPDMDNQSAKVILLE